MHIHASLFAWGGFEFDDLLNIFSPELMEMKQLAYIHVALKINLLQVYCMRCVWSKRGENINTLILKLSQRPVQ